MASRTFTPALRQLSRSVQAPTTRSFTMTALRRTDVTPLPVRKPVGAFRGGLFGFLLGSTLTGAGIYYYILDEYKVSNQLLTEDIYTLQSTVQRVHSYVQSLEEKVAAIERKGK